MNLDFIGSFPIRKNSLEKKGDAKKQPVGPVFPVGAYKIAYRKNSLGKILFHEFEAAYRAKHNQDKLSVEEISATADSDPEAQNRYPRTASIFTKEIEQALVENRIDVAVLNMKDIPLDLPPGLIVAAALRREDPRDALITRATYGAIQELPTRAKVGTASRRRIMQIKSLRPDIEIIPMFGDLDTRIKKLEALDLDAVVVAWASLRRLNVSPRFYVSLQPELMIPAASQGTIGLLCREADADLLSKLRYIEDGEASWSARCERAFLAKLGGGRDTPVGVYAHRKGTQDPWILDAVIGDSKSGEVLKHREIGTSRCKPESLADKAFIGILSKGARKFLPFT
jgi:hydroxymethylbilane synthase